MSAEAANRDLEARLSRANDDRRDCESRLADVHADVGRCARQKLRKGEWTRGNGRAKGANWTKFTEIRTKFVRNSYEFRTNFVRISHLEKIHTNLFT